MYFLRKCSLEIELWLYDWGVCWSALGISRVTALAKQLSCVGSYFTWFRSTGVKEESTQPVWDFQMHSIFLQSRFSLDSSCGCMGFICKTSWRKPYEELSSATSGAIVVTIAGSFCIIWLRVVWVQQHITIVVQGVYVKLWFAKVSLLMLMSVSQAIWPL
jgi:hypothetical protein